MVGFFFDGETSLVGLGGARGGVPGRAIGGALQGERRLVGVGEYVRIASPPWDDEEVSGLDEANEADRIRVDSGRAGGMNEGVGSGELVRSMTSCAQFDIVLWPFRCGGRIDLSG